jgi:hypothetical protein
MMLTQAVIVHLTTKMVVYHISILRTMRASRNTGKDVVGGMEATVTEAAIIHVAEDNFMTICMKAIQFMVNNLGMKT